MRTPNHVVILSIFAITAFAASSDVTARYAARLDAVPPYPASGIIPESLQQQFVFRDLSTGNLVLSYPADLAANDSSSAKTIEGGRVKQTIVLANRVDPFIDVAITSSSSGLLYSYTVSNTKHAQQAIASWRLDDSVGLVGADVTKSNALDLNAPVLARGPITWTAANSSVAPRWVASSSSYAISPGSSSNGFSIHSTLRPGFIRAFASGSAVSPLQVADAPEAVQKQLSKLEPFSLDQQAALTIGPKFSPATPDPAIAADLASGIQILVKHGYLSENSLLVRELRTKLQAYSEVGRITPDASAEQLPRLTLQIQNKPSTDLERIIVGAIQAGIKTN